MVTMLIAGHHHHCFWHKECPLGHSVHAGWHLVLRDDDCKDIDFGFDSKLDFC
jgi:hypothetical protein